MNIDPKNLRLLTMDDLLPGATFYKQESSEDYAKCMVPTVIEWNKLNEWDKAVYRQMTVNFQAKGILFVNRDKPGKNFL